MRHLMCLMAVTALVAFTGCKKEEKKTEKKTEVEKTEKTDVKTGEKKTAE